MAALRVLMMLHIPWDRRLGGARPQMELSEYLREQGAEVEHFSITDAYPRGRSRLETLLLPGFEVRATQFVRERAADFDVIDAHHGNLPMSKTQLGFNGALVARSVGLAHFYYDFIAMSRDRWPDDALGRRGLRGLRSLRERQSLRNIERSLSEADLALVTNRDERDHLVGTGVRGRIEVIPYGVADDFLHLSAHPERRRPEVVFVGTWDLRKGRRDWPTIVREVLERRPDVGFHFIGTGKSEDAVQADLPREHRASIRVTPRYEPEALPAMLSGAAVGALPSYIEGFPIAVVEQMAVGLPVVAYDVPGCRELPPLVDPGLLVGAGQAHDFASVLLRVLNAPDHEWSALAKRARRIGTQFTWRRTSEETFKAYQQVLETARVHRV
jgi:glycosyltransferase involved in cell wall biosynthesis